MKDQAVTKTSETAGKLAQNKQVILPVLTVAVNPHHLKKAVRNFRITALQKYRY
ncbi:hypothetical protein [Pseudoalteromonas sp. G4]|uniref:hypothetical protein n=1 Tax=Pseudoalteromonas sp. G4 TaxID=2992761 RepID=UPI00237E15E6|nr:hypothetical protein [Pseudoalteromonas sp. G4]MDE3271523.1 hypothetical protein [Pseudoalteromonas sp. G4]